ncbi:hypothetical protein BH23GEM11_BH23GEM11_03040 [soil metagenome]
MRGARARARARARIRTTGAFLLLAGPLVAVPACTAGPGGAGDAGTPDPAGTMVVPSPPPVVADLEARYAEGRVDGLEERTFSPEAWWDIVLPLVQPASRGAAAAVGGAAAGAADDGSAPASPWRLEEIGRSAEDRPLRLLSFGSGPMPVLLWSQMHGDESTASMALADLVNFFAARPDDPWVRKLGEALTIHLFPVMNPDGAERFQRRNAQGVDLNRDARALATPEGQALKALQERFRPVFGFNLHDQAVGTRVGRTDRGTAIALLAPPFNEEQDVNDVRRRAMEISALIRVALEPRVGGYMAKWDDTFNPRAFGDLMQAWGVSTILIESGGWEGDPQKQFLRELNFVALGTALDAMADESYARIDTDLYQRLPENGRRFGDLMIRGATLHSPGLVPLVGDLLVNFDHPLAELGGRIAEVGDLAEMEVREVLDAEGMHLFVEVLQVGAPARFRMTRDAEGRDVVWVVDVDAEGRRP